MALEITSTMVSVFTPYRAIGREKRWIANHDEHRAYLREHGYEEVGTDSSMAPPAISDAEHAYNCDQQIRQLERDHAEISRITRGSDLANPTGEP